MLGSDPHAESLWLWSDALGGNIVYVHDDAVAAANRQVTFCGEEFVNPADATLFPTPATTHTLYCYERCLKGGLQQGQVSSESDLYYAYAGTPFQYTLSVSNGTLADGTALGDGTRSHLVRAMESEQTMQQVPAVARHWTSPRSTATRACSFPR